MQYVLTITTEVILEISASALFLWFSFSYFKPKIEISPHLDNNFDEAEDPYLEVKFINLAPRALNNVKVEV